MVSGSTEEIPDDFQFESLVLESLQITRILYDREVKITFLQRIPPSLQVFDVFPIFDKL